MIVENTYTNEQNYLFSQSFNGPLTIIDHHNQWRIQDFVKGAPTPKVGAQTLTNILANFPPNCTIMKKNGLEVPLLDPSIIMDCN